MKNENLLACCKNSNPELVKIHVGNQVRHQIRCLCCDTETGEFDCDDNAQSAWNTALSSLEHLSTVHGCCGNPNLSIDGHTNVIQCKSCGLKTGAHGLRLESARQWIVKVNSQPNKPFDPKPYVRQSPEGHLTSDCCTASHPMVIKTAAGHYHVKCQECNKRTNDCLQPQSAIDAWFSGKYQTTSNVYSLNFPALPCCQRERLVYVTRPTEYGWMYELCCESCDARSNEHQSMELAYLKFKQDRAVTHCPVCGETEAQSLHVRKNGRRTMLACSSCKYWSVDNLHEWMD